MFIEWTEIAEPWAVSPQIFLQRKRGHGSRLSRLAFFLHQRL